MEEVKKLYSALVSKGYTADDLGDENVFAEKMLDEQNRRELYDYVSSRGDFKIGDYENYERRLKPQPVVDEYGMPVRPQVSTIEDMPKAESKPSAPSDEFTVTQEQMDAMPTGDGEEKSDLFRPKDMGTRSMLDMGYKPEDKFATALSKKTQGDMMRRRRQDYEMISGLAKGSNANTPESAARLRATLMEKTGMDPAIEVPGLFKDTNKPLDDDTQYANWLNLSEDEREAWLQKEQIHNLTNPGAETREMLEGIRRRADEGIAMLVENQPRIIQPQGAGTAIGAYYANALPTQTAKALTEAGTIIEAYRNHQNDENFFVGAAKGLKDGMLDIDNWTGVYMAGEMGSLYNIADKMEKGEALTQDEEDFLDAQAYRLAVEASLADDLGWGYKSGNTTGASIPFMLQMLASPVNGSTGAAINKGFAAVGKRALSKFGGTLLKKIVNKAAGTTAGRAVQSGLSRTVGGKALGHLIKRGVQGTVNAWTAGTAQTLLFQPDRMAANIVDKKIGDRMVAERADAQFNTNLSPTARDGMDWLEAGIKGSAGTISENATEFFGGEFLEPFMKVMGDAVRPGVKAFLDGTQLEKFMKVVGESKAMRAIASMKAFNGPSAKFMKEVTGKAQWNGLFNEYLEEVVNGGVNVLTGDMEAEDWLSVKHNAETLLGLAWTSGAFGALNAGARTRAFSRAARNVRQIDLAAQQYWAENPEQWEQFKASLEDVDSYEELLARQNSLVDELGRTSSDKEMNRQKARTAMQYMQHYAHMMGMNAAEAQDGRSEAQTETETALGEGMMAETPEQQKDIVAELAAAQAQLEAATQGQDADTWLMQFGETPDMQLQGIRESGLDEQTVQDAETYIMSLQRYNGVTAVAEQEIEGKVKAARAEFDANVNADNGRVIQVHTKATKDMEDPVYVIKGNTDGGVITIRRADGSMEQIPASDIVETLQDEDAAPLREAMMSGIEQEAVREVAARMQADHVITGAEMQMQAGQNVIVGGQQAVVTGMTPDGTYTVQTQEGKTMEASPQDVTDAASYNAVQERMQRAAQNVKHSITPQAQQGSVAAEEAPQKTEAEAIAEEFMDESLPLEERMAVLENNKAEAAQALAEAQAAMEAVQAQQPQARDYRSIAELKAAKAQWQQQMSTAQAVVAEAQRQSDMWDGISASVAEQAPSVSSVQAKAEENSENVEEGNAEVAKAEAIGHNAKIDVKEIARQTGYKAKDIRRMIDFANQQGVKLNFANYTRTGGDTGAFTNAQAMAEKREITISKARMAEGLPLEWVMGHEMTHQVKADGNAENWGAYRQSIINAVGEDTFRRKVEETARIYRAAGAYQNMTVAEFNEAMEEEVCADMAGYLFLNPYNINKVMGVPESLVSRIWNWMKSVVGKDTPQSVKDAVKAWGELAEGKELTGQTAEGPRHSIVGTTGARALDKAEGTTVRMDNKDVAEEMEAAGKDAETIWMATGWERGADGKWKYEVLDGQFNVIGELHPERRRLSDKEKAELDGAFIELMDAFEKGVLAMGENESASASMADIYAAGGMERSKAERLSALEEKEDALKRTPKFVDDYLENSQLFDAYPELREIKVEEGNSLLGLVGTMGSYNPQAKVIKLNDLSQDTLLHEIQHVIQHIEGFATGGSVRTIQAARKKNNQIRNTVESLLRSLGMDQWFKEVDPNTIAQHLVAGRNFNLGYAFSETLSESTGRLLREKLDEANRVIAENNRVSGNKSVLEPKENYRRLAGETEARNVQSRLKMSPEERRQTRPSKTEDVAREEQTVIYAEVSDKAGAQLEETASATRYSIVADPQLIAELEASPKRMGYRNVVQREDGLFEAPMGNSLRGNGITVENTPFAMGQWEQSEEHPELVYGDNKITLVKPDGKTVADVNYNPYIHNRLNTLNAQFKQAWERPDLVYVETEVPVTDLEGGYMAEHAHLSTGIHQWSNGALMLSRYDKPVRIVPWDEVAIPWIEKYKKSGVHFDIVPPALRPILTEAGVKIKAPHKGMGENCIKAYEEWKVGQEKTDRQGNPINENGTLVLERVGSVAELTDSDFEEPSRNIILPKLPENVDKAIGAGGKDVIIKKNIFERNYIRHSELTPDNSREILQAALYSPDIYGQNQKSKRPKNWVVISVASKSGAHKLVLLEISDNKKFVEIVHWHYIDQRGIEKIKRQAGREGGQLLILPSVSTEEVGALSDLTTNLSSASKDTQSVSTEQTDRKEISEKGAESNVEVTNEEVMHSISPIEGYTYSEVIDMVQNDVENILSEEGTDNVEAVEFWAHGSRMRGNAREDSDLDVVMFYKGNEKEDSLFNLINEHELAIDGIKVDVNPIRISNEQDIARYKEKSARYDQEMRFSLAGLHNISEEKLKKAIKQGGLANPSVAVIDLDTRDHNTYGDITLVLPSYMIDRKQGRNAGTYMGDAWTPTYPRVSMRLDNKGWRKIDEFIASISDDAHMRSNMHYAVEDFMQGGTTPYMQYAFLRTKGIEIPFVYKNNDRYISNEEFKELIGMDALTAFNGSIDAYNKFKELPKEVQDELYIWIINRGDKAKIKALKESLQKDQRYAKLFDYEVPFSKFNMFASDTFRREQDNGKIDYAKTFSEANNHVATNGLGAEYNAWISNLLEEAGAEEYIFAGFTPSGNAKYLPHTLENVSKVMKKDGKSNAYNDTGYGPTRAGIIKALSTLGQIRKNSDTLRTDINTVDETKEELADRLYELRSELADMRKLSDNPFINGDYAERRLQEALSRKNPVRHLNEEYGYNIEEDGDFAKKLESFIDDVRKAPVRYFETKFERPVMLDEFHAAVIPNDTDTEVVKALEKAGLNVETYERGNDAERKEALLRASDEHVRFSLSADILAANERFNEELGALTQENADSIVFELGSPSAFLRSAGVHDKPMKLYGSKIIKKQKKHGFRLEELRDLPMAMADPIAVFDNHGTEGNRSILTELSTNDGNVLVAVDLGKGTDIDFNIISSAFGKDGRKILHWINKGYGTYYNKEKTLEYLHLAAPIAAASDSQEFSDATKVVENFQNPPLPEDESSQNDANATPGVQFSLSPVAPRREEESIMDYAQRVAKAMEAQKAMDVVNRTATDIDRQMKESEEYRRILAQKDPQTIEEAASVALAGGKLLWDDHVDGTKVSKGVRSMMGWGEGERRTFFAMFAAKENGGASIEQIGESVMEICSQYNIPVDETDAMAGVNAVLEVLQSAQRPSDITGYIEHNRIEQVRRMIEEEQEMLAGERNRAYMDMYGMTYDDFVEIAGSIDAEDEQERTDDKNVIAWLYGQSQRQQERIANAQAELERMKENGVPKAQYDAAYRALERMKAKAKQTQEKLDEVTRELRAAKGQATRQRKANMRYKAKKGQWKQVFRQLREAINGKNIRSVDKSTLNEIMRAVGSADLGEKAKLFGEMGAIEDIILGVNMRATQDRIDKLLATKTTALNDKGIATGKSVDASVQAILANVRKTLEGILHHDIENRIHDLRSRNWHIRHNALGDLSQEQQAEVDANNAKIAELKAELDRELATNTANTEQAVNEQIEKLTEQIDKKIRTEEESAELMTTLALKRQTVAIHTTYQDTTAVEALLRRKQSELRTYWVALHDGNTPQDRREEYRQKRKALQEQIAGLEAQVREGRQATLDAMQSFADSLEETITTGRANLKGKMQEQLQRRKEFVAKAIHDVNASGRQIQSVNEAEKQENDKLPWYKRMFSPALRTFDYMLQKVATRTYGKDSWLYRQFMLGENGVMAAHDEYLRGMQTAARTLEDKAKEIFGKSYQDVMADSNRKKDIGIEILRDAEDYEPSYIPLKLTKGQATYIYMLWRMRDGYSKLATQGFTEEIMERIEEYIGDDYIRWADWVQTEYLPMMREKYNSRYREIYDTNMAAIDNYVPIRIHGQAIRKEVDLTDATASLPGMQKKNGALIQRTVNVNPIDISNNVFELIGQHIDEMEEFYAYAPVRRDLQYVLSSPAFRSQLNAQEAGTFQSLLESARIATKTNQQPESAALKAFNDIMNKTQKGLVSANIAYRNMTAIKQVLSAPAFIGYSQSPVYLGILAKNMLGGYLRNTPAMALPLIPGIGHWAQKTVVEETAKGMPYIDLFLGETFRWCMREFPDFRERVTRGSAGDIRLEEKGFSELLDKYTELGMSANVFIDAVTVSIGLKSIYDYEMQKAEGRIARMAEQAGFNSPEERAEWMEAEKRKASNLAKIQATLFANQTQQSSNPALLSPMQVSKNFMERSLTLYKNSSLGLMRTGIGGMRDMLRYMKGKKARRRMTEEYTRMFIEEGFSENDAKKMAISYLNSGARKGAFVAVLEGFVMNVIWNLGSKGLLGFMDGGDEPEKERTIGEWVWDVSKFMLKNTVGSAIPFVDDVLEGRLPAIGLTTSEAEKAWKDIARQLEENGISLALALTGMRYAAKFGGVDMQVWANTMDGYYRLVAETGNDDETILALMLILNSPHSNRMAVARDLYKGKSEEEFQKAIELAGRYNQPVWTFGREMTDKVKGDMASWYLYDNATKEEKQRMLYVDEMEERIDNLETIEEAMELYDEVSDTELRKKISGKMDRLAKPMESSLADKVSRKKEDALAEDEPDNSGYAYLKMSGSRDLLEDKRLDAEIDALRPVYEGLKEAGDKDEYRSRHREELLRYSTLKRYRSVIGKHRKALGREGITPGEQQEHMDKIRELRKDALSM